MSQIAVAASDKAFKELFAAVRDNFQYDPAPLSWISGAFAGSLDVALHLENGTVEMRDDGTVKLSELDIKYDTLAMNFGIDIPEINIGSFCVVWLPFVGCVVRFPGVSLFGASPDISIPLDLSGLVATEISGVMRPDVKYQPGTPNQWQVFLKLESVDLDVFDIADMVGDLFENLVTNAVEALLPGDVADIVLDILGPVFDWGDVLDIPDDIGEWLQDLLGTSIGLTNMIVQAIANWVSSTHPLAKLDDPFTILPENAGLIPVKVPISNLTVQLGSKEMVLSAELGGV